jgi:hypothetical protein
MPAPDRQGQAWVPGREAPAADVRLEGPSVPRWLVMTKPFLGMMEGEVCAAAVQKVTTAGWHSALAEPAATSKL